MRCASCGFDNPDGFNFCGRCGVPLTSACPACGRANPSNLRFCGQCGADLKDVGAARREEGRTAARPRAYTPKHLADKILTSRSALEGERKQVTVLFADVKGSMELSGQLDPEEWHTILDRFFQILTDGVHRFDGTVNQYTGDGIMALFGAPIAHEDHAQRACYAALHLRDELRRYADELRLSRGLDFSVRIGVNSGEVVVGKIGDDLRMDYTAQGHTVGLAQRMEQLAAAHSICVSESTAAAAAGYVAVRDLGTATIKGASEPVRVFELDGIGAAQTRFDVSRARGLVRFVGRDEEMETLEGALERARAGEGRVVGIVAEAGTGKSRLCFEFLQRCRARGLRVLEGRCVAHGRNLPFLPVLEVLRSFFGIAENDDDRAAREKIAGRLLLLDESYRDSLPLLFEFLGVPDPAHPAPPLPPEARQRRLFAVLRRVTQGAPRGGASVGILFFEDLHWIDRGSEAWLAEWAEATTRAPTLLLVNFRPEFRADWMRREHYREIALAPLSPQAIGELLSDLIGDDPSTSGLAERIHAHTTGNPFFAEEVVRTLIESGRLAGRRGAYRLVGAVESFDVPPSVQAVLAARIDRLGEHEKRVLQTASVIGRTFEEPLLRTVAELPDAELSAAIEKLREGDFVHEQALYPVAEYAFKHPLTQAVAQGSLLRERRRAIHAAVAAALEARSEDLDEDAALLAHHWEEAAEPALAARWHLRAADWIGPKDVHECGRHARAVVDLSRPHEGAEGASALLAQSCARLLSLGWRIGLESEAPAIYADGRRWAQAAGDVNAEARMVGAYAAIVCVAGRIEESLAIGAEFPALAERAGDAELQLVSRAWMAYPRMRMGRLAEAEERILLAIAAAERNPDLGVRFLGASIGGLLLHWLVEIRARTHPWPEVDAAFERALGWVRDRREAENECLALSNYANWTCQYAGELQRSLALARQSLTQAEELGSPIAVCNAKRVLASCLASRGENAAALDLAAESLEVMRARRVNLDFEPLHLSCMALARLGTGDAGRALDDARAAVAGAERIGVGMHLPDLLWSLARVHLATGALDEAAATLDRMEAQSRAIGAANHLPLVAWQRAELAGARGDDAERRRRLGEAQRVFAERGAAGHAETIGRSLAS